MPQLSPDTTLDPSRFLDYEQSVKRSRLVSRLVLLLDRPGMAVCDVGGASGVFLTEVARRASQPFKGAVLDVAADYREHLERQKIDFVCASIVDNELPDAIYDVVTARHVLHHLVGATLHETQALQRRGIAEMVRLLKPGGVLLLEEQVNLVRPFSRIVYYASRLANQRRFRWKFFDVGGVVVSFMTPREICAAFEDLERQGLVQIVDHEYQEREVALRWRLTGLMAFTGNEFFAARKG